jgi:hypothetical protein
MTYLQPARLAILFKHHFQVHVKFGRHGGIHQAGKPLLDKVG